MNTDGFIQKLLDNACPAAIEYDSVPGREIHVMWIQTHCVGWWVRAYKGEYEKRWHIISATPEDS